MAVITAFLQTGLTYNGLGRQLDYQVDNPNLPTYVFEFSRDPGQAAHRHEDGWSTITVTQPQAFLPGATVPAFAPRMFAGDWYERIHVVPKEIALGALVAPATRDIEVWNGYREQSRQLTAVTGANTAGLTLTEPVLPPTTFAPLESRIYQVHAALSGPPVIDGTYTWVFDTESPQSHITARVVLAWAFAHNWAQPPVERLAYRTDVLVAYDGTEQRIRLLRAPRRSLVYTHLEQAAAQQLAHQRLRGWQTRLWGVPIWWDASALGADLPAASEAISVDTTDRDYAAGALVMLRRDARTVEMLEITAVQAGSVQLAQPTRLDWAAGDQVMPARLGRMEQSQSITVHTASVDTATVRFLLADADEITAEDAAETYRTLPIFPYRPNWDRERAVDYERKVEVIDNGIGPPVIEDESGIATETEGVRLLATSRAETEDLRRYFAARAGKLVPCWLPTFRDDITLAGPVPAGQTTWPVVAADHARFTGGSQRRDIEIRLRDGSTHYRRITDTRATADPTVEEIVLETALSFDLAPADVLIIGFMRVARLAGDALDIERHTQEVARTELRLRSLVDDV